MTGNGGFLPHELRAVVREAIREEARALLAPLRVQAQEVLREEARAASREAAAGAATFHTYRAGYFDAGGTAVPVGKPAKVRIAVPPVELQTRIDLAAAELGREWRCFDADGKPISPSDPGPGPAEGPAWVPAGEGGKQPSPPSDPTAADVLARVAELFGRRVVLVGPDDLVLTGDGHTVIVRGGRAPVPPHPGG